MSNIHTYEPGQIPLLWPLGCPIPVDVQDDSGESQQRQVLVDQVFGYYHQTLLTDAKAREYLHGRGIVDQQVIEHFRLGFSDRSIGLQLPSAESEEGAVLRGCLQRSGLFKPSGHELFRNAIVFPIENGAGEPVAAYARVPTPYYRARRPPHVTWSSHTVHLFNETILTGFSEIILCKSPLEAAVLWGLGYPNVVATLGPDSFSETHLSLLEHRGISHVCLAWGSVSATSSFSPLVLQALLSSGIACSEAIWPKGEDASSLATAGESGLKLLHQGLLEARPCTFRNLVR